MKYKIIISQTAAKEFTEHIAFLANVSRESASQVKKRMLDALGSLEEMPNRFPFFSNEYIPKNKYHKLFVQNGYLVLYQIKDDTVFVDYILDCRQEYKWLIQ